jgi:hypothetical protein
VGKKSLPVHIFILTKVVPYGIVQFTDIPDPNGNSSGNANIFTSVQSGDIILIGTEHVSLTAPEYG